MQEVQVCSEIECDKFPTELITIGRHSYVFCCQKGFEKSLAEFNKFISGNESEEMS